jgi:hypothetical protein
MGLKDGGCARVVVFESRGVLVGSGEGGYYVGYLNEVRDG